jgi:hypothetical protein
MSDQVSHPPKQINRKNEIVLLKKHGIGLLEGHNGGA